MNLILILRLFDIEFNCLVRILFVKCALWFLKVFFFLTIFLIRDFFLRENKKKKLSRKRVTFTIEILFLNVTFAFRAQTYLRSY